MVPPQLFMKIKVKQECGLPYIVSGLPEEHWLEPSLCAIKELLENSNQHLESCWPVLTNNELPESYPWNCTCVSLVLGSECSSSMKFLGKRQNPDNVLAHNF